MPYVERDESDNIVGLYARPQPGRAEEKLPDDHVDVVAFRTPKPPSNQELADALAFQEKVFRAATLVTLDEVNALRTNAGLATRSVQQLKNAVASKMGEL